MHFLEELNYFLSEGGIHQLKNHNIIFPFVVLLKEIFSFLLKKRAVNFKNFNFN